MRFKKNDRGVAGLTILLSVVTMLFVIGLLIMIYALMGGELGDADSIAQQYTGASVNQNETNFTSAITLTTCSGALLGAINDITVQNATAGVVIDAGNWSASGCIVTVVDPLFNNTLVNFTYDYTYAGASFETINDTIDAIGGTVDWFPIFIVITAMVVLVLLTVIIIVSIRGSGLMGGTERAGSNVGSA